LQEFFSDNFQTMRLLLSDRMAEAAGGLRHEGI